MKSDLIFDFFGTLVEHQPEFSQKSLKACHGFLNVQGIIVDYDTFCHGWTQAFAVLYQENDESLREFSLQQVADRFFLDTLKQRPAPDITERLIELFVSIWSETVSYHRGTKDFLGKLQARYRLSIISNTHYAPLIDGHLKNMSVKPLFEHVTTSVEYGFRKPHPGIFRHTLNILGIQAADAVFIGDSYQNDFLGAENAGLEAILIDKAESCCDPAVRRVRRLFELEKLLLTG